MPPRGKQPLKGPPQGGMVIRASSWDGRVWRITDTLAGDYPPLAAPSSPTASPSVPPRPRVPGSAMCGGWSPAHVAPVHVPSAPLGSFFFYIPGRNEGLRQWPAFRVNQAKADVFFLPCHCREGKAREPKMLWLEKDGWGRMDEWTDG